MNDMTSAEFLERIGANAYENDLHTENPWAHALWMVENGYPIAIPPNYREEISSVATLYNEWKWRPDAPIIFSCGGRRPLRAVRLANHDARLKAERLLGPFPPTWQIKRAASDVVTLLFGVGSDCPEIDLGEAGEQRLCEAKKGVPLPGTRCNYTGGLFSWVPRMQPLITELAMLPNSIRFSR
jgi:hypothetical protein